MNSLHLIVMSRAPVAGGTKSRLIPLLGAEGARDFHVACINDILAEGRAWRHAHLARKAVPVTLHLFITPAASQPAFRQAGVRWPDDYALHNQHGDTLGGRMRDAIARVRQGAPPGGGVLLIGSDLPLLRPSHLEQAVRALERADVVFGPTSDGGYYLIGVKDDLPGLFDLKVWGGTHVLRESLAAARAQGLVAAVISPLPDADTGEDLRVILAHSTSRDLEEHESLRIIQQKLTAPAGVA